MFETEQSAAANDQAVGTASAVDDRRYRATEAILMDVLPTAPPGLTEPAMIAAVRARLPRDLFPDGEKAGWWTQVVQIDLEARGVLQCADAKPPRWYRAA